MTSSLNEFMMAKAQQYHDYFTQLESKKKEHMDVMESLASELSNFKRYVNTYEHQFQILKLQNDNQLREANTKISQLKCSKTKLQEEVVQLSHEKQSLTLQCDHLSRSVEKKKVELQEAEDRKKSIVDFIYRNIPNLIKDQ
jgi:chromosome segregation ATPase